MPQISYPVNIAISAFYKKEREAEHDPPRDNVYQYLQRTTGGCKRLFHVYKDNQLFVAYRFYRVQIGCFFCRIPSEEYTRDSTYGK